MHTWLKQRHIMNIDASVNWCHHRIIELWLSEYHINELFLLSIFVHIAIIELCWICRYDKALSREQKNKNAGKMYVQDKIEEYSDEIFKLLDGGAHIYFCGLKGMMPGIQDTLKKVAEQRGESWEQKLSQLKKNKQWHVEVY